MQHAPGFLKIVNDAKSRVKETTVDEIKRRLDRGDKFMLIDVREESEFSKDHLPGAVHLGKGIIERDIEARVPNQFRAEIGVERASEAPHISRDDAEQSKDAQRINYADPLFRSRRLPRAWCFINGGCCLCLALLL